MKMGIHLLTTMELDFGRGFPISFVLDGWSFRQENQRVFFSQLMPQERQDLTILVLFVDDLI